MTKTDYQIRSFTQYLIWPFNAAVADAVTFHTYIKTNEFNKNNENENENKCILMKSVKHL